ncbi:hypothetical protein [Streptomyces malaysiense]|uniref:DUF308 domain-containing protein n=1 Tax=Streptomyces malaysiense TaxID=1428626 RepID=A0A1J4Q8P9_9ACTN|nr:hypothetical protein [Streptomyces malaysiense]OIK29345.1 hypothetical protein VT52_001065 [Streptomyces malaysiense]
MAEHDPGPEGREDREDREERRDREPEENGLRFDEDAAWRAIVAGYGEEPPDPPGSKPFKPVEDLALLEKDALLENLEKDAATADEGEGGKKPQEPRPARPLGGSVSFAPGVGPRDHRVPEPSEDDFDEDDEGHFVPPEPPPLDTGDTTSRFAWLGVVGGPVLLLVAVLLGWEMTWWLTTLAVGGFLGGFATLVARMRTDEDDDDDPGRGAVV